MRLKFWKKEPEKLNKKEELVKRLKDILSALYVKIGVVNSVMIDPGGLHASKDLQKYAALIQIIMPLLDDWAKDEQLKERERKEIEKLFAREKNPIMVQFLGFARFTEVEDQLEDHYLRTSSRAVGKDIRQVNSLFEELKEVIEALRKVFAEENMQPVVEEKKEGAGSPVFNIEDPENWILLPGKRHGNYSYPDMLVSMNIIYKDKSWNQAHILLKKQGMMMLTMRQFVDFLNVLMSRNVFDAAGNKISSKKVHEILSGVLTEGESGEWLDAAFNYKKEFDQVYITYHKIGANGLEEGITEPLQPFLKTMFDEVSLGLNYWLEKATDQGLPGKQRFISLYWDKKGINIFYSSPYKRGSSVTCFYHNDTTSIVRLNCEISSTTIFTNTGVRPAVVKKL